MPEVDVCYVNEQGELICGSSGTVSAQYSNARTSIQNALNTISAVSDSRLNLIMRLIEEVAQSPVSDNCIDTRSDDTVQSVHQILQTEPPVMLLFRYVSLPGNIMAAYYVQQDKFPAARGALDDWATLKIGC